MNEQEIKDIEDATTEIEQKMRENPELDLMSVAISLWIRASNEKRRAENAALSLSAQETPERPKLKVVYRDSASTITGADLSVKGFSIPETEAHFDKLEALISSLRGQVEQKDAEIKRILVSSPLERWVCFHCGFRTSDDAEAEAHFGERDDAEEFTPTCKWWQRMSGDERLEVLQETIKEVALLRMELYEKLDCVTGRNFAEMQQRAEKAESALATAEQAGVRKALEDAAKEGSRVVKEQGEYAFIRHAKEVSDAILALLPAGKEGKKA
jgi:hypothetical protein